MSTADSESMRTVVAFLRRCSGSTEEIDGDRDLIEARILDSLTLVEFLLLLEEIAGAPIDLARIDVDLLRTLNGIGTLIADAASGAHV
ncbi:hypothetical protein ND748_04100 [Frankia sp. AiPs1]|uniref:hypothetical protein n=1 Tax=Frankia sp. AiPs1 TaxID=573493 RepID=UPI002042E513|nr:hypothetical protein [Frankia sp. AiPs1]MCM3920861.1 hypothetical protein [Frankia sp. AiPs1]